MIAEIGSVLVGLALAVALYAAWATFWGIRQSDSRWTVSGRNGVYAATGLLALAVVLLTFAFLSNQFQIEYVFGHSNRALPLYLKISAVWGGQEGSLLLWSFLQALFAALVVGRPSDRTRSLVPWATVFLSIITAFFTGVTLFLSNPFLQSAMVPTDGLGLNPLLRHPGMVFHPPVLYLGYVGLAVPFAFGLAALLVRQVEDWPAAARRWTLTAWLFLGVGIVLGARWAYDVLGWGGYWGWDPVENAGLLPWLTTTALLHSAVMQEQRGGFRVWNLLLAVFSFALVLFGTFTTRSGLIQSVHAFARSDLGSYFLGAIGLTLVGSLALLYDRRSILVDTRPIEGLISRDGMFFLALVLFLTLTGSVLIGSVLPTLTEVLAGQRFEAGPAWFDRVTGPQFALLALVMGICPLLGQAAAALRRLRGRGLPSVLGAALVTVIAALAGFTRPVSLIGFAVIGLAGATIVAEYVRDVAARGRRFGEGPLQALFSLVTRNHRRYGGYLVHAGVILMALGIIGTRMYPFETELVFSVDQPVDVGGYTLVYQGLQQEPADDHMRSVASLAVYRGGDYLTTLQPELNQYVNFDQTVAVPALRVSVREDLYLVLAGWSSGGATATLKVIINPLAIFLWVGSLVFLTGGAVALWPAARAVQAPTFQARRRALGTGVLVAVVGLVLIAAGMAMWSGDQGLTALGQDEPSTTSSFSPSRERIRPGQMAPDFDLRLLDGSTVALSELSGQVVLVNFWATWCPPCEDELPDLQAVWEEYQQRGVVLVGIAFEEDEAAVQEMASRFSLTYPLGLDVEDRISLVYGITGVPETFVIDSQGLVSYVYIGPVTAEQLRGDLDGLLDG